jgi:hypothetical protein
MLTMDSSQITPTQFLETINVINELLISAHSIRHSFFNNLLAVFTLQISRLVIASHYDKVRAYMELSCGIFFTTNDRKCAAWKV